MIEKDIIQYLQTKTDLTTKLGGVNKINLIQAPTTLKMPWLLVEASGGPRDRISATKGQAQDSVRIAVDAGPSDFLKGREAIELARGYLENLRGTLGDATDLVITVQSITGYPGLNGAYRYSFPCVCKYIYPWATQRPST